MYSAGLLMLAPLLPVLANASKLGVMGNTGGGDTEGTGGVTNSQAEVLAELRAIRELLEQGADIRINEKMIGRWMGKYQSSVNTLEN